MKKLPQKKVLIKYKIKQFLIAAPQMTTMMMMKTSVAKSTCFNRMMSVPRSKNIQSVRRCVTKYKKERKQ
jgi:hypothetical protein